MRLYHQVGDPPPIQHVPASVMRIRGATLRRSGSVLALVALVACGDSAKEGSQSSADSGRRAGDAWFVDTVPLLRVGNDSSTGSYLAGVIVGAATIGAEHIAIADGSSGTIVIIDSAGRVSRRLGGTGAGPGEFRILHAMSRCLDGSLVAVDFASKFVRFDSLGGYLGETAAAQAEANLVGCRAEHDLILRRDGDGMVPPGGGLVREPARLYRFRTDSGEGSENTLGRFAGGEYFHSREGPYYLDLPLGARTVAAIARAGVYIAETDQPVIQVIGFGDSLRGRFTIAVPRLPVGDGDMRRAFDERLARVVNPDTRRIVAPIFDEFPDVDQFPYLDALVIDDRDRVWVRTFEGYGGAWRRWHAFDRSGSPLGELALPAALEVTEIRNGHVLGILRDSSGAQTVALYQLQWSRGSGS